MNPQLQKIFSTLYAPELTDNEHDGASSIKGTAELRNKIISLFEKHGIKSMFDAGCNDCNWMKILSQYVDYHGGDISLAMVAHVWRKHPELDVILHDVTSDAIPNVDVLFVRDVAIHLDYHNKRQMWNNWFNSNIPWILITHNVDHEVNCESQYSPNKLLVEQVNWVIDPWNFPTPKDFIEEYRPGGRCMGLWHRDQFNGIL